MIVALYVPTKCHTLDGNSLACLVTAHSELAIASNNFAVEVYQGAFLEFLGQLA